MSKPKITCKKYMGDDIYSWAVFVNREPVLTGLSHHEAQYERDHLKEHEELHAKFSNTLKHNPTRALFVKLPPW